MPSSGTWGFAAMPAVHDATFADYVRRQGNPDKPDPANNAAIDAVNKAFHDRLHGITNDEGDAWDAGTTGRRSPLSSGRNPSRSPLRNVHD